MSDHVEALEFRLWRDHITSIIQTSNFQHNEDNRHILREIRAKLDHFDDELTKLKDVTTILELALWKLKMSENGHQDRATQSQQKMTADESSIRSQNRVTCGADVVIGHVLPFLISQ
jgi:demethoxyubiquinone hydroxylase (CLK1/Coq7/Cat5 family)